MSSFIQTPQTIRIEDTYIQIYIFNIRGKGIIYTHAYAIYIYIHDTSIIKWIVATFNYFLQSARRGRNIHGISEKNRPCTCRLSLSLSLSRSVSPSGRKIEVVGERRLDFEARSP